MPVPKSTLIPSVHFLCWLALIAFISGCSPRETEYRQTLFVFGTLVEVTIVAAPRDTAGQAMQSVESMFRDMHRDWHPWEPGGEIYELNRRLKLGESVAVSDALLPVLIQSKRLYQSSDGLFNPAIGALVGLWGFHSDAMPGGAPPRAGDIESLVSQHPGMDDLLIESNQVVAKNPAVQLDMGGFAKGYALNRALDLLREKGVRNAIVNAGGDLCVSGDHDGRPWRIGIRHPQGDGVIASVEALDGECVLTSGNYERYREHDGKRYAHIIDPRSGWPVDHIVSATVIHGDGGVADAAATALTVAGPAEWQRIARRMGLVDVMLVDGAGTVYMSPSMRNRLSFEGGQPENIYIGEIE